MWLKWLSHQKDSFWWWRFSILFGILHQSLEFLVEHTSRALHNQYKSKNGRHVFLFPVNCQNCAERNSEKCVWRNRTMWPMVENSPRAMSVGCSCISLGVGVCVCVCVRIERSTVASNLLRLCMRACVRMDAWACVGWLCKWVSECESMFVELKYTEHKIYMDCQQI